MNHGEGEHLRRRLLEEGCIHTSLEEADVNILFTCVVIRETEKRMFKRVKELTDLGKPLIVAGCIVSTFLDKVKGITDDAFLVAPNEAEVLGSKAISKWLVNGKGSIGLQDPGRSCADDRGLSSDRKSCPTRVETAERSTFVVPISQGCLGKCAYCLTKKARGILKSYPMGRITDMVRKAVEEGNKEIQLTSQDTGIFGRDTGRSLPVLLDELVGIPWEFRIRVGMMNPTDLETILPDLIRVYASKKIFKFLHLPVQSGDNSILKSMNRCYTTEDFRRIIMEFRKAYPDLTLSTDIITGFPGEDEDAFQRSVELVNEIRPDLLNITRFSERPGTAAVRLPGKVHGRISKERSRILTELRFRISRERNTGFVGGEMKVLATEKGKGRSVICRDDNYRTVVIREELQLGQWYHVKIVDSTDIYLLARLD